MMLQPNRSSRLLVLALILSAIGLFSPASAPAEKGTNVRRDHPRARVRTRRPQVCARCILAHEEFLASDALRGRGSATHDELVAATYIASELRAYGIQPAGDEGGFIQTAPLRMIPYGGLQRSRKSSAVTKEIAGDTWNVVGILQGRDLSLKDEAILFSAHLDHLGIGPPVNGDDIYNGADDDASGVTAVLELARVLGAGRRPRRTVIFAFFGSEEIGGKGSTYFRAHPPVPLQNIVANLEFEMIGRPDPAVKADTLWLTGWDRSNLGPVLAEHGARLVLDPHPGQNFFARSDNYVLAKKGVVAQTVSSFGLHKDYHEPSDDLAHLDFHHMDIAIGSMLPAAEWLVNSNFKPQWKPGMQP